MSEPPKLVFPNVDVQSVIVTVPEYTLSNFIMPIYVKLWLNMQVVIYKESINPTGFVFNFYNDLIPALAFLAQTLNSKSLVCLINNLDWKVINAEFIFITVISDCIVTKNFKEVKFYIIHNNLTTMVLCFLSEAQNYRLLTL